MAAQNRLQVTIHMTPSEPEASCYPAGRSSLVGAEAVERTLQSLGLKNFAGAGCGRARGAFGGCQGGIGALTCVPEGRQKTTCEPEPVPTRAYRAPKRS